MNAAAVAGVADAPTEGHMSEKTFHDNKSPGAQTATTAVSGDEHRSRYPSLAESIYFARRRREREALDKTVIHSKGISMLRAKLMSKKGSSDIDQEGSVSPPEYGAAEEDLQGLTPRELELINARRMLRQAGWATIFYLVTSDILGPFNAPYAIASIGMVPGILLYILFGAVAFFTGVMLCWLFCDLDSVRHPVRTYGDLAERIYGTWFRHFCSVLQAIQLVLNCGLICLSNGQSVAQIARGSNNTGSICFSVAVVIFAIVGIVVGQIRSLGNFSIMANASVWINLLIIFLSMGFIAHSPPNYAAAASSYGADIGTGPVIVQAIRSQPVFAQVNGVFNMVFAYGGAMIFPELMAEMRRPRDFIKGMALAQLLIFVVYLVYGIYVYALQGQYTLAVAYQGVSKYSWQTVGNVLALITGSIAAGLYGLIGLKVVYVNIVEGIFRGPPLMSFKGRLVWSPTVILWWSCAFVIGSAIPAVGALSGLVAAVCIFQFTYTFPPLFMLGYDIGVDAMAEDEPFTTPGVRPRRIDSWKNLSRWQRGIFGGGPKRLAMKGLYFFMFLASCATAGLGMWATGTDARESLSSGAASSLGCTAPV